MLLLLFLFVFRYFSFILKLNSWNSTKWQRKENDVEKLKTFSWFLRKKKSIFGLKYNLIITNYCDTNVIASLQEFRKIAKNYNFLHTNNSG